MRGGMPEIIQDGINGYVVPMKGYEELASRIVSLFNDDQLRDRLGNTGRSMVEKRFTRKSVAEANLNLYYKYNNLDITESDIETINNLEDVQSTT